MRYEKSDAQLDAEANRPSVALHRLVELHRSLFRDDLHIQRLVGRQPPTTRDSNTGVVHQHEAAVVGMNMSARLYRYVEAPTGSEFPWTAAWKLLRVECRRRHHDHRSADRPYWRGSLCHEAVKLVIIGGEANGIGPLSPEHAGRILRIDRIDELLARAFRFLEETMDDFRARAEKRAREDEGRGDGPIPVERPQHHSVPGLHAAECPQCRNVSDNPTSEEAA
jgi:hypothetical protein